MNLSKYVPVPMGVLYGILAGAMVGGAAAVLLSNVKRGRSDTKLVAKSPGVGDLLRFVVAAMALMRIANEFLGPKDDEA